MQRARGPRVLVVDDERTLTDILAEFLEDEGYRVERAYDGEQALRIVRSGEPPDLLLSDVMMPRMSGLQLVAEVRRLYPPAWLPVVLLSAGGHPSVEWENVEFLPKPLQLDNLLDRIEAVLGRNGAQRHAIAGGRGWADSSLTGANGYLGSYASSAETATNAA